MGKYLKHIKVSVHHQDCPTCLASEKFPEIKLEQASEPSILQGKGKQKNYQLLFNAVAPDRKSLEDYLSSVKNSKRVREVDVLKRSEKEALFLIKVKATSSYDTVLKSNVICTSPVMTEGGYENYDVLLTDPDAMKKLLNELSDIGQMKILRIGDYQKADEHVRLTTKQKEALTLALAQGYYRWPKKVGLEDLAAMQNISRRSFQERLRRAESNVFPYFLEKYLNIRKK
ncbi:MAG: helix-turn-helix domain-containing protein [Candidatus Micrarchaeota archaeon]